jgi:hypothetical protein
VIDTLVGSSVAKNDRSPQLPMVAVKFSICSPLLKTKNRSRIDPIGAIAPMFW